MKKAQERVWFVHPVFAHGNESAIFRHMQVTYYDECKWVDVGEGLNFEFVDSDTNVLARVSLRDADAKLWSFEVVLPKKFQVTDHTAGAIVYSQASARKIAEAILTNTIITR